LIGQLYRRASWCSHPIPALVIPGSNEVASYDAQLRIRESIGATNSAA
jgi:hypothetical protein